jgi:hypothetical protein
MVGELVVQAQNGISFTLNANTLLDFANHISKWTKTNVKD